MLPDRIVHASNVSVSNHRAFQDPIAGRHQLMPGEPATATDKVEPDPALLAAYRYLQEAASSGGSLYPIDNKQDQTSGDGALAAPLPITDTAVDQLIELEDYPGEAFTHIVNPTPVKFISAFLHTVQVAPTDIVGVAAPSTQLWDNCVLRCYSTLADSGLLLTTKYPPSQLEQVSDDVETVFIDATPHHDSGTETPVHVSASCRDLTSLGVTIDQQLEQLTADATNEPQLCGLLTLTQMRAYYSVERISRFVHEICGRLRQLSVGGIVHAPPAATPNGELADLTTSMDYVIEGRTTEDGVVEARVRGKNDVDPQWRSLGLAGSIRRKQKYSGL
ncbi:hypothetical protein SAMN06264855_13510 [Halorubrum vacuolatum]|uniref:Uncharacterized protein n=1 Tax=Halorubrum vacuolatum TaxID=63740 RepID=A0A238YCA7_HALVU|nr:hypothetical protein [Halorubrum vacuolatum]SNR67989.1 hypothetical protein SAMN06264855_13510 [Halorubrum vacuolatum]